MECCNEVLCELLSMVFYMFIDRCDVDMNVSVSSWWFMSRNFVLWESSAENKQSVPFGSSKEFFLFARSTKMKRWHQTASGSNSYYELPV